MPNNNRCRTPCLIRAAIGVFWLLPFHLPAAPGTINARSSLPSCLELAFGNRAWSSVSGEPNHRKDRLSTASFFLHEGIVSLRSMKCHSVGHLPNFVTACASAYFPDL